jgi:hypothetical protein
VGYPVEFSVDYADSRSRLSTFFRLFLAIPLVIWGYVYGILATIVVIIAWFAIVITGRYPRGLYEFEAGWVRFLARLTAYVALLCDGYPSFVGSEDPDYPVRMSFQELDRYSRVKTGFRIILAIPILVVRYVMQLMLEIGAIGAWFVIVFTGGLPRGLFDLMVLANSYIARSDAYLMLLTETYPPFQDEQTRSAGQSGPPAPDPSQQAPPTAGPS